MATICLHRRALEAAFVHIADPKVDEAELADHYATGVLEHAIETGDPDAFTFTVPAAPADMLYRLDTIVDDDGGPLGRDWGVVHVVALRDGRVCAFGAQSRCGDGCCADGIWFVADSRAELPATLFS